MDWASFFLCSAYVSNSPLKCAGVLRFGVCCPNTGKHVCESIRRGCVCVWVLFLFSFLFLLFGCHGKEAPAYIAGSQASPEVMVCDGWLYRVSSARFEPKSDRNQVEVGLESDQIGLNEVDWRRIAFFPSSSSCSSSPSFSPWYPPSLPSTTMMATACLSP